MNVKKRIIASALAIALCAAATVSFTPNKAEITADAANINYQVLYLKQDSQSLQYQDKTKSVLKKGYYTGYKLSDNWYYVASNNEYKIVPASRIQVKANTSSANKILPTGTISQLGEGIYYGNGCGPTCVTMVADWELNKKLTKNEVIAYYRQSRFNAFVRFSSTENDRNTWCYSKGNGTPNYGVQYMVDTYAKTINKGSFYYNTLNKTQNQIIDEIDALLKNGHRVIACVKHESSETGTFNGTIHNYSGRYTHWIVITAETGSRTGNYYIADPLYADNANDGKYTSINGNKYYYGLEERSKSEIAKSIQGITSNKIAGLITVKG